MASSAVILLSGFNWSNLWRRSTESSVAEGRRSTRDVRRLKIGLREKDMKVSIMSVWILTQVLSHTSYHGFKLGREGEGGLLTSA